MAAAMAPRSSPTGAAPKANTGQGTASASTGAGVKWNPLGSGVPSRRVTPTSITAVSSPPSAKPSAATSVVRLPPR